MINNSCVAYSYHVGQVKGLDARLEFNRSLFRPRRNTSFADLNAALQTLNTQLS